MIDYKAIAALQAVIETQSFDIAAKKLSLTQSAVSQRIKGLENFYGKSLIVRTLPYHPTVLGETLLGHYKRVLLLEQNLKIGLVSDELERISIAISRDSLETWFMSTLNQLSDSLSNSLEIISDDQDVTHEYLRKGLVSACASTSSKVIAGCKAEFIGYLDYILVATTDFKARYFSNETTLKKSLLTAPTLLFDHKDTLQKQYLAHFFNITDPITHYHTIPSVAGFRHFALNGYAYALIPEIDIMTDLKQNKLINLFPGKIWRMPIYWHTWEVETKIYKEFNQFIINGAKKILRQ